MRVLLTAGFDRAPNVLALGDLLLRDGHEVGAVLVVNPFSLRRLRSLVRQRGKGALAPAVRQLLGVSQERAADTPLDAFLKQNNIRHQTLRKWCAENRIPHHVVPDLNHPDAIRIATALSPDVIAYGGGGILRGPFIRAAKRGVLNAHSGLMPEIRGMNACEWSLLLDIPPAVTIHFIDEGIDTGAIIETIPIPIETGDTIERLRDKCVVAGVEGLRRAIGRFEEIRPSKIESPAAHRQCFVLAPVLKELLERKLALGRPLKQEGAR